MELLIATGNAGKVAEMRELLKDLPVDLRGLADFGQLSEVEETGATFTENAALKARYYARNTGLIALADDSGLEVFALGNAPGIYSARYAGANASDAQKTEKLLRELKATGDAARRARFVCAMTLANPDGTILFTTEGICAGCISDAPRGVNGFGYDPVFIPDGYRQTFGELFGEIKHKISHRARAAEKIIRYLADFIVV